MQELVIPHFQLTDAEQQELITCIKDNKTKLETYYRPIYNKIRDAKYAKNTKNPPKALLSIPLMGDKDKVTNRPDIHLPLLKDIANSNIAEFVQGIFSNDFLAIESIDPQYASAAQDMTDAFNAVREETRTDEREIQIIDDACWQGTCPIVIENSGRYNATHEIIDFYEVDITPEMKQLAMTILNYGQVQPEQQQILMGVLNGNKIIYYEEEQEHEGEKFNGAIAKTDTGIELDRTEEDVERGIPALDLLKDYFEQLFFDPMQNKKTLDFRLTRISDQQIKTTESWIQGLPRPKILNMLQTYVVPASVKDDPDTMTWLYWEHMYTQDIVDNHNFMNLDKLKSTDGVLIGSKFVNTNDEGNYNSNGNNMTTYTTNQSVVKVKQAYFDQYKFTCSGKMLRNFICTTVKDEVVIECRPNVSYTQVSGQKISKNPLILVTYYKNSNENIGTSPILDSLDLSKASNILCNYALDSMSRNGNKYAYFTGVVDIKTVNGGTSTLVEIDAHKAKKFGIGNVKDAFQAIDSNHNDAIQAINSISMFRDQIQQLSNSSQPYFQSAKNQTATEVSTVANQASGMVASRIKHISRTLSEVYQRMLEDLINRGIKIERVPTCDSATGQSGFKIFDFGEYKGKKFIVRITSVNPQLSKTVQANVIKELLTLAIQSQQPEILSRINISEMTEEIMKLSGIENPDLTRDDDEAKKWILEQNQKEQLFAAVTSGQYRIVPSNAIPTANGLQQQQPSVPSQPASNGSSPSMAVPSS